jgi:hypothetical protein
MLKTDIKQFRKAIYFLCFLLFLTGINAQDIPVHHSHTSIYIFIDELANDKVIDINTVAKPYSRTFILEQLKIAKEETESLSKRQKEELEYYLKLYALNDTLKNNPNKESARINIFRNSNNFNTGINPIGLFYKDSLFTFSLKPIWGIRYYSNKNNQVQHTWGGAEIYGTVGKNWTIYVNARDNYQTQILSQPEYFTQNEGGNFKKGEGGRNGGDYSEVRGGITYNWNWGSIGIVKDHLQWGNNYNGANIFSGRTPSFGMIKLRMNPVNWLEFNYFHGWLVSEVVDSARSYFTSNGDWRAVYRNKYIAANIYTLKPFKNFYFSVGNSIVYSDMNPHIVYLIPFLFYKSADHTINHSIDNQNSQMFADFSFRMIKHLHVYGSMFVDEFSFTRIGNKNEHNFLSYKSGFRLSNWPIQNVSFTTEYTKTYPITYKHRVPATTFESNKYNLGHYLRDNSEEIYFSIQYKPIRGLNLKLYYVNAKHGNEYAYTNGSFADEYPIMQDLTWKRECISLSATYEFVSEAYLYFEFANNNMQGFAVDGQTAQYYLDLFTPELYHGNTNTITLGFNIGF